MKAKPSALRIEQFTVLNASLKTILTQNVNSEDLNDVLQKLSIDIDFDVLNLKKDDLNDKCMISVTIKINESEETGYCMEVEAAGVFYFGKEADLTQKDKKNLIYSGISMCITNIRNYMVSMTSFSAWGAYVLPPIDMNDLLKQKQKQVEMKNK